MKSLKKLQKLSLTDHQLSSLTGGVMEFPDINLLSDANKNKAYACTCDTDPGNNDNNKNKGDYCRCD